MATIAKIALLALGITIVVTLAETLLLLRQARKPASERKGDIFKALHLDHPKTDEDWEDWEEKERDEWKESWEEEWDNWPGDAGDNHSGGSSDASEQQK